MLSGAEAEAEGLSQGAAWRLQYTFMIYARGCLQRTSTTVTTTRVMTALGGLQPAHCAHCAHCAYQVHRGEGTNFSGLSTFVECKIGNKHRRSQKSAMYRKVAAGQPAYKVVKNVWKSTSYFHCIIAYFRSNGK